MHAVEDDDRRSLYAESGVALADARLPRPNVSVAFTHLGDARVSEKPDNGDQVSSEEIRNEKLETRFGHIDFTRRYVRGSKRQGARSTERQLVSRSSRSWRRRRTAPVHVYKLRTMQSVSDKWRRPLHAKSCNRAVTGRSIAENCNY